MAGGTRCSGRPLFALIPATAAERFLVEFWGSSWGTCDKAGAPRCFREGGCDRVNGREIKIYGGHCNGKLYGRISLRQYPDAADEILPKVILPTRKSKNATASAVAFLPSDNELTTYPDISEVPAKRHLAI